VARAVKPGGVLLLVDHPPGRPGRRDAGAMHRIEEAFALKDFESRGFELTGQRNLLLKPEDKRDLLSYEGPGLSNTDRFVLVFRKRAH
jgi:predicted methyltransferase